MIPRGATLSVSWGARPIAPIVGEGLDTGIALAQQNGFDAIELSGNVNDFDAQLLDKALTKAGLTLSGVMTGAVNGTLNDHDDTLSDPDKASRDNCLAKVSQSITFAAPFGALVSIGLGVGTGPRGHLIDSLQTLADQAATQGVRLCIEPVNRYLASHITTIDDALAVISDVGNPALGITLDVFQANIEETSIPQAIAKAGPHLFNVQLADNTRGVPGTGSIDFNAIKRALSAADFNGWLSAELMPNADAAATASAWKTFYEGFTTMAPKVSLAGFKTLADTLNNDPVFRERAAYFRGDVALNIADQDWVFTFADSQIVNVALGLPAGGADIRFSGPDAEWDALFAGQSHLHKALNPFHGKMGMQGDPAKLAGNMRPIFYLFSSLKEMADA